MQMNEFLFKLSLCPGLGPVSRYQLWQAANKQQTTDLPALASSMGWNDERVAKIAHKWASQELADAVAINNTVPHISILDKRYPARLKEIYCPPLVLYYVGNWQLTDYLTLAVVGSRKMTDYGRLAMNHLLPTVVREKDVATVSGLARGVDGMCHKLTIGNYGRTIGVIGTGLDVYYPRSHSQLQHQMAIEQLVVTEYPLGTPAYPHHFPERNRIIAGLCHSCLVVQAQQKSGSLITASLALQENRNVMAVPGPIDCPYCEGTNELIAAGARPVLHWSDILEELNLN